MSNHTHVQSMDTMGLSITPRPRLKMRLPTMMAICIGLVIVQGSMISATQGIGIGGMSFIAAMIAALALAQFNAMSFAELSLMFPQEGTLATYTQKAIGHFPAIVAVFAGYVVVAILAVPVEMFLVDGMLAQLFPGMLPDKVVPLLILGVLTITNLVGADVFARVQNLLAFVLVSALILVGLTAITGLSQTHPDLAGQAVDWSFNGVWDGSFIGLIALAMWMMVGVEFICPMINEVKQPRKNIPRAMHLSLLFIFLIFLAFAYGASLYLSQNALVESPLPYLDYVNAVFGKSGLVIATVMALAATCSTINTVLASVPKMLHGMAMQKQAFPQLKAVNRFDAPWAAIVMLSVCTAISYFIFEIDALIVLVIAATTSWLLAYIVAHIDVIVLRQRLPKQERPYRTPFYPWPQIIGIVSMLYVALNNSPDPSMTRMVYTITGSILLIISLIAAFWVKFYMKRGLFEPDVD
ncbi:APC family permease [Vibrio gazogenes]|uniref:Amino acid permease n=1 Tax=Vibrio gazogenes DSM 21264 = NBRC 103151 TaxID=1123492 RepID=A0A1M4YFU3_VIBGA|nr:APC family permease [Vibrio gazogenes]USP14967.1 APC family permease [Vibrio gazogenes]SHF04539.1 Amino acid permease [Vibrio gazogenes DSM 21264] [Vibrio gazogenes DSM 21264 = NBRC 103151]SJN55853.1 GABA permease [Vibrio gazogenes]